MNIGIDFGTTNSIISYNSNNKINILKINNCQLIPSKILITNDNIFYGLNIPQNYKNGLLINNFKNKILENKIIKFNDKNYNIDDLIKEYLKYLTYLIKNNIENKKKEYICVISVPNNFDDFKKKFIKNILEKENIYISRIINEASAAAISHSLNNYNKYEKILVIDIGGGTTDLTILEKDDDFFEIIDSFGDSKLGGNDFTNVIIDNIKKQFVNINEKKIWYEIDEFKKKLMNNKSINIIINNYEYELNQEKFKTISKKLLTKLLNLFKLVKIKDIDNIILVGGSSNLELVKNITKNFFNMQPYIDENLQTIVSKGNCELSCYLSKKNNNNITILDIVKLSIGIETSDDNYSVIVPKGTTIPTKISKKYVVNNIEDLNLNFYQGNRLIAKNNLLLSTINLNANSTNINDIIEITISVDINELIKIIIKNINTNKIIENKIEKKNIMNLNSLDENIDDNKIYLKNKIIFEIKNIIKNYLELIENKNYLKKYNDNTKKNLNNILQNLNKKSLKELSNLKKKLYKKISFKKI